MAVTNTNVPAAYLAKLFGITQRRVQQLAQEKTIPKSEAGKYPLLPCVSAYVKSLQDALRHGGGENGDIARARARYEIARAEEKELEVAKLLGDVVLSDDVQQVWDKAASNWRARVLALPSKIAIQTATISDRHEIEDVVTSLIESTLTELATHESGNYRENTKRKATKPVIKRNASKAKTAAKANS